MLSARRAGEETASDQRILGRKGFVERVLKESKGFHQRPLSVTRLRKEMREAIEKKCRQEGVNPKELQMGSRRGRLPWVRSEIAAELVKERGMPLAEVARELGVSTSAISKILRRAEQARSEQFNFVNNVPR